jgi:hypothetical protein
MKKLVFSILFVVALAMMVFNVYTTFLQVQAGRPMPATLYALLTLLWLTAALQSLSTLVPRFGKWMAERTRSAWEASSNFRIVRELSYAVSFLIPLIFLPLIALSFLLAALFSPIRAAYRFVGESWRTTCDARRKIELSYRESREACDRAKSRAEHDAQHGLGLG